jgi:hypothetical protein
VKKEKSCGYKNDLGKKSGGGEGEKIGKFTSSLIDTVDEIFGTFVCALRSHAF